MKSVKSLSRFSISGSFSLIRFRAHIRPSPIRCIRYVADLSCSLCWHTTSLHAAVSHLRFLSLTASSTDFAYFAATSGSDSQSHSHFPCHFSVCSSGSSSSPSYSAIRCSSSPSPQASSLSGPPLLFYLHHHFAPFRNRSWVVDRRGIVPFVPSVFG